MPLEVSLSALDWEDRERVLRLMFSKMNSGQPPSNWRMIESGAATSAGRATSNGGTASGRADLNRSFRMNGEQEEEEEDDAYDQEIDEDNEGGEDEDDSSSRQ